MPQSRVGRCGGNFSLCNLDCTTSSVTMPSEWGVRAKELVVAEWRYLGRVWKCVNPSRILLDLARFGTGYISVRSPELSRSLFSS